MEPKYNSEADIQPRDGNSLDIIGLNPQQNDYRNEGSRWDAVYSFCNCTNAHGFYRVAYGEKRIARIFWTVVLSCSILASLIHIGLLLKRHLEYDVNAKFDLNTGLQFSFPDITICPTSRYFLFSGVPEMKVNQSFYLMENALVPSLGENVTFEKLWSNANNVWLTMLGDVEATRNKGERRLARFSTNPFVFESQVVRHKMNMAIVCSYKEKACSHRNYSTFYHPDVHVCITFHPQDRKISTQNTAGGLVMDLVVPFIGEDDLEESKTLTEEESDFRLNGATVIAHPSGSLPNFEGFNVVVSRGRRFSIGLEMTKTFFLDVNDRCAKNAQPILLLQNGKVEEFQYSQYACSQVESQESVIRKCDCLSELYYIPAKYASSNLPFCHTLPKDLLNYDSLNVTQAEDWIVESMDTVKIFKKSELDILRSRQACHHAQITFLKGNSLTILKKCKISCVEVSYDIQVNSAASNELMDDKSRTPMILEKVIQKTEEMKRFGYYSQVFQKLAADILSNKLSSLQYLTGFMVYPIKKSCRVFVEELVYPEVNFFCDMGGVLGFWMGFSIITMLEVIEFAMMVTCFWRPK